MTVFKLFFKIMRDKLPAILSYAALFFFVFNLISAQVEEYSKTDADIVTTPISIKIFDHDESPISQAFTSYMESNLREARIKIEENPLDFQEDLYNDLVSYIVVIPEGFSQSLEKEGSTLALETHPGCSETVREIVDSMIISFFRNWDTVVATFGEYPQGEDLILALERLEKSMNIKVDMKILAKDDASDVISLRYFFTYIDYIVIALAFIVIGNPLVSIEDPLMKRRDIASGSSEEKRSLALFIASYTVMFLLWGFFIILAFYKIGFANLANHSVKLMLVSNFVHMLAIVSLTLLIIHLFPKKEAISFFSTLMSLLLAFSSGVFIPKEYLFEPFHKASAIFPTYWDVYNQYDLYSQTVSESSLDSFYRSLLIMGGMAILYFLLTLIRRKFSRTEA